MRNAIILSQDLTQQRGCSLKAANRLLYEGHARILKFYPFTLQLKGVMPFDDEDADYVGVPVKPNNNPPVLTKKRKFSQKVEVAHEH